MIVGLSYGFQSLGDSVRSFWEALSSGWLLFGDARDLILAVVDVAVTTMAIYFVLKLMSDSRAWQLMKGMVFILIFTAFCNVLGLQTLNYILVNSLSFLAIGFVVIFQPELRRALETVGRRSLRVFSFFSSAASSGAREEMDLALMTQVEAISQACEQMAKTYTGALILVERKTRLGDLLQETAVRLDTKLSAIALEQIFYKGSPLHDGAVLVRGTQIYAARCHVPLSDSHHLQKDYGTRHRAAVGASEIGDTLAIVVSEERGQISLAMGGRLYPMRDALALRNSLYGLLVQGEKRSPSRGIRSIFHKVVPDSIEEDLASTPAEEPKRRRGRVMLKLTSFVLAVFLWGYVQTTLNPIQAVTLTNVPVQILNSERLAEYGLDFVQNEGANLVQLRFEVRRNNQQRLTYETVRAEIDLDQLDLESLQKKLAGHGQVLEKLGIEVRVEGLGEGAYVLLSRNPGDLLFLIKTKR